MGWTLEVGRERKLRAELTSRVRKHYVVSSSISFYFWNLSGGERKRWVDVWDDATSYGLGKDSD